MNSDGMVQFQKSRREELMIWPGSAAIAVATKGVGSRHNTAHLNLSAAMEPQAQRIRVTRREAKASSRYRPRLQTIRRAMIARELAMMGIWKSQAARLLNLDPASLVNYEAAFGFKFPRQHSKLRDAIRAAYAPGGGGPREAMAVSGASYGTVRNTAHEMGLTEKIDAHRFTRGFIIPGDRRKEYADLTKTGCTPTEAGQIMGLIPREPVK